MSHADLETWYINTKEQTHPDITRQDARPTKHDNKINIKNNTYKTCEQSKKCYFSCPSACWEDSNWD